MSISRAAVSPLLLPIPEQLDGRRIRVRPPEPGDAQALWEAVEESRAHLGRWFPWAATYHSVDDARTTIARIRARWLLREDLTVSIFERETGRLLGGSGLHRPNWDIRAFEIGYWLRQTAEGRGYVREAVQLLTNMAFETLQAKRVEIRMDVANIRSRRVAERLGFVLEGTLRNSMPDIDRRPHDTHIYALVPDDYDRLDWSLKTPLT